MYLKNIPASLISESKAKPLPGFLYFIPHIYNILLTCLTNSSTKKTITLFLFCIFLFSISKKAEANCSNINSSFTPSQTVICGPASTVISFTNTSTGTGATAAAYTWYLNGSLFGTTSGLVAPPTSTISTVGTYTYMLVAFDSGIPCRDTAIVQVFIRPVPVANFTFINNQCDGSTVMFTNTSTGTGGFTTYTWDFGDGGTSTLLSPSHVYSPGGAYTAKVTVTNGVGCVSTINHTVNILTRPTASISGDDGDGDTEYCLPPSDNTATDTITFSNLSTGAVSYSWNFGDGSPLFNTASAATFKHVYTSYATFTVSMIATGGNGCSDTTLLLVVFDKFVSASFIISLPEFSGCLPHTVTPTNASQNADKYIWNFGDGTPSITTNSFTAPTHIYTVGGSYTVSVTASNSCNLSTSTVGPITVVGPPTMNFSATPALGCSPQSVTFGNTTTGAAPGNNFNWDFGDGTTLNNVKIPAPKIYYQGTWTIRLISGSACGKDTMYRTIVVDSVPTAIMTANPLTGCTPLSVATTNNSLGGNLSYQWFINGSQTSTSVTIPNQTFTAPAGNMTVTDSIKLKVTNHCGVDDSTVKVIVHPQVVAILSPTDSTICAGSSINFAQTSTGDNLTYAWNFGNGNTSTSATPPAQTYSTPGIYIVLLTVTGYCGIDTTSSIITVNPIPVADIIPDLNGGCSGLIVNFTNNSSPGGNYNWSFAGAAPATSTLYSPGPVTFNTAGNQMVYLKVNVAGCIKYDTSFINVTNLPTPGFTITPNAGCSSIISTINNTSGINVGDTYIWNFDNGTTSGLQNPPEQTFIAISSDTIYNAKLIITASNGCTDSVMQIVTMHPKPIASFTLSNDTVCANTAVVFSNNSIIATGYKWSFGDLTTSIAMNPTYAYSSPNNYAIQLIAMTAFGCKDTTQSLIVVDSVPTAAFTNSTECFGFATQFTNTSIGNIMSRTWNFGDSSPPDNADNPSHTYAAAGKYYVLLSVTNMIGCSDTIADSVVVNPIPVAAFINTTACLGQATVFTDQSSGTPINWIWDFGDGTAISTSQHPLHTYLTSGNFNVTLISSGGSGCSDTLTNVITVNPVPAADFTSDSVCANHAMLFNNTSLGVPDTFVWDFGDGATDNTDNSSPAHVYPTAGTYDVLFTSGYSSTGCTNSKTIPVTIFPHTVPGFTSTTPCLNVSTVFSDATTNAATQWTWDFGDGSALATIQSPTHIFSTAATFLVTLFTQNTFGCTDSVKINTIVNPLPVAAFAFDTICENTATTFTDQSTSSVSRNWDFGDGTTSTLNSPIHVYPAAATYNVTLIVANLSGCTDTISHSIIVNPNPISDYTALTTCHTYPTLFTDNSTLGAIWAWDFGDVTPADTAQAPAHIFANPGNYSVELVVKSIFGCTDSSTQIITVLPQPVANYTVGNICARDTIPFTDISTGTDINTWAWDFGDGGTAAINNPMHVFQLSGNYNISLIVTNNSGCADTIIKPLISNTVPSPFFSANASCLGAIASFTDLSTDAVAINSWFYDFDDGNNSISQNPDYIFYAGAGVYNVSLTITNIQGCDSSVVIPVTVNIVPVANYTADTICIGTPTTFADVSTGNPSSWHWTFGDGNTDTIGPVTSHLYNTAGSFVTSLTASSGAGCSDVTFRIVEVRSDVHSGIIASDTVCINESVVMNDNSVISVGTFLSDTWDFGDGSPIVNTLNTSHVYTAAGIYTITHVVVSDGGCANTGLDTIVVNPFPVANFTSSNTCQIQASIFNDNSTGSPTSWLWDFGDGGTSTIQNPTHQYSLADGFNVTLIVSSTAGCADTVTNSIAVFAQPIASFTSNVSCWGDTTAFLNTSTTSGGVISATWWDFGDGTTSTFYNPEHILVTQNDSFNVTLAIATSFGCVDTITQEVTTYPLMAFNYAPLQTSGCDEFTTTFYDSSTVTGGTIVNWLWNFGDGNMTYLPNPTHTYDSPGSYYTSLTVTNSYGCQMSDSLYYPVVVYPTPMAGFLSSPQQSTVLEPEIQFYDDSHGAILWDFDFGDNETSINQNPLHTFPDTGTFIVTQIAINQFGCKDSIQRQIRIDPIATAYIPNAFTPDENNLNDVFKPEFFGMIEFSMLIFDRWGNEVFKTNDINEGWNGRFKGSGEIVQRDVYVYKIVTKDIFLNHHSYSGGITLIR